MEKYLYLLLIPESLVASNLPPEAFGAYLATGAERRSRGQALFFEVKPGFETHFFNWEEMERRCVPHENGTPRKSSYLSIYRALEHIPLSAIGSLFLATADGRVLALEKQQWKPDPINALHLYQEFCPVTPQVVSSFSPDAFWKHITDPFQPVSVPQIVFAELDIEDFAFAPERANPGNLPYANIEHLRDCLISIKHQGDKPTKAVSRSAPQNVLYRTIKNGFFLGGKEELFYYPMPSRERLESDHYSWWRSAQMSLGY